MKISEGSKTMSLNKIMGIMIDYYKDVRYIEHALKVYSYSAGIGGSENLDDDEMLMLLSAALLHDIGIPNAIKIHGSGKGPYQEKEGALLVPGMLKEAGVENPVAIERIKWLVGHHHTEELAETDKLLQILMEADYLVNIAEGRHPEYDPYEIRERFFKTAAGKEYITNIFNLENKNI